MSSAKVIQKRGNFSTFYSVCWICMILAFLEIVGLGVAVAMRLDRSVETKYVERIVSVPASASSNQFDEVVSIKPAAQQARTPEELLAAVPNPVLPPLELKQLNISKPIKRPEFYEDDTIGLPEIKDPRIEKLIIDGRNYLVKGDAVRALLKLQEALGRNPKEVQAQYFLAQVYEQIGQYTEAGDYYEKVHAQGISGAGVLYTRAGRKLAAGFDREASVVGEIRIGQVKKLHKEDDMILLIPVMAVPNSSFDPDRVLLTAYCFIKDEKGDVRKINQRDQTVIEQRWLSDVQDWATGEEVLRIDYLRPNVSSEPHFYGYVVTLSHKNEVLDLVAWPRSLARKINVQNDTPLDLQGFENFPDFLDDLNLDNPLLPKKN